MSLSYLKRYSDRLFLALLALVPERLASHWMFLLGSQRTLPDRWGYHIRPIHFYEPLPDFRQICLADLQRRRVSPAIEFDVPKQVALVRRLAERFRSELDELAADPKSFDFQNDYFAGFDAAFYYALIRDLKPTQIIEIGGGYSTRIANKALLRNQSEGNTGKLVCVEPYPEPRLLNENLEMTLITERVEQLNLDLFRSLSHNDVLFIDSSHALKHGGDVHFEFLEVLPVLAPGVWVHIHDVFFPYDYPAEWLIQKRIAFTEQYLLEGFLMYNQSFSVQAVNNWLATEYWEDASLLCPAAVDRNDRNGCASFWMKRNA